MDSVMDWTLSNTSSQLLVPFQQHPKPPPTKENWLKHRCTIIRLYLDEDRKLADVMEIMKTRYHFHATIKMYKTKFRTWNIDLKHLTRKDADDALRQICELARTGRDLERVLSLRKREVTIDSLYQHLKRSRGIDLFQFYQASYKKVVEPEPSPCPADLQQHRAPEGFFNGLSLWASGCLETGTWYTRSGEICYIEPSRTYLGTIDFCFGIEAFIQYHAMGALQISRLILAGILHCIPHWANFSRPHYLDRLIYYSRRLVVTGHQCEAVQVLEIWASHVPRGLPNRGDLTLVLACLRQMVLFEVDLYELRARLALILVPIYERHLGAQQLSCLERNHWSQKGQSLENSDSSHDMRVSRITSWTAAEARIMLLSKKLIENYRIRRDAMEAFENSGVLPSINIPLQTQELSLWQDFMSCIGSRVEFYDKMPLLNLLTEINMEQWAKTPERLAKDAMELVRGDPSSRHTSIRMLWSLGLCLPKMRSLGEPFSELVEILEVKEQRVIKLLHEQVARYAKGDVTVDSWFLNDGADDEPDSEQVMNCSEEAWDLTQDLPDGAECHVSF